MIENIALYVKIIFKKYIKQVENIHSSQTDFCFKKILKNCFRKHFWVFFIIKRGVVID